MSWRPSGRGCRDARQRPPPTPRPALPVCVNAPVTGRAAEHNAGCRSAAPASAGDVGPTSGGAATADRRHPAADPVPQWPNCPLVGFEGARRPTPPPRPRGRAHGGLRRAYVGRPSVLRVGRHAPGCAQAAPAGPDGSCHTPAAAGGHRGRAVPIPSGTADRGRSAQRAGFGPAAPDLDAHGVWGSRDARWPALLAGRVPPARLRCCAERCRWVARQSRSNAQPGVPPEAAPHPPLFWSGAQCRRDARAVAHSAPPRRATCPVVAHARRLHRRAWWWPPPKPYARARQHPRAPALGRAAPALGRAGGPPRDAPRHGGRRVSPHPPDGRGGGAPRCHSIAAAPRRAVKARQGRVHGACPTRSRHVLPLPAASGLAGRRRAPRRCYATRLSRRGRRAPVWRQAHPGPPPGWWQTRPATRLPAFASGGPAPRPPCPLRQGGRRAPGGDRRGPDGAVGVGCHCAPRRPPSRRSGAPHRAVTADMPGARPGGGRSCRPTLVWARGETPHRGAPRWGVSPAPAHRRRAPPPRSALRGAQPAATAPPPPPQSPRRRAVVPPTGGAAGGGTPPCLFDRRSRPHCFWRVGARPTRPRARPRSSASARIAHPAASARIRHKSPSDRLFDGA